MISLDRFDIFKAVVDAGSLSAAAKALGFSRAVVSFNLKRLEADLGVALLTRNTRSLTLTDAGERFYERCVETLESARRAIDEARGDDAPLLGRLRITTTAEYAAHAVIGWVNDFHAAHPGLRIHLSASSAPAQLISERFDLAVRLGRLQDAEYRATELSRYDIMAVAAPALLERAGRARPNDPAWVLDLPRIGYPRLPDQILHGPDGVDIPFPSNPAQVMLSADNASTLLAFARAGHGVALMPRWLAAPSLAEGALVALLRRHRFPDQGVYAVYPNTRHVPHVVRRFIDHVRQVGERSDPRRGV